MIRNSLLAATATLLLAMPASAQKWAEKMFETTSHDFGTIARDAKAEYKFVLKNTVSPDSLFFGIVEPGATVGKKIVIRGTKPFRITSITPDCHCLTFDIPDAEPPKPLYVVPIVFTASGAPGKVSAVLRVETDLDGTTAELEAHAAVVAK